MKKFLLFSIACFLGSAFAEKTLAPEAFLKIMRTPREETWGSMSGTVTHRKRGKSAVSAPIRFSILFTSARTIAKIRFRENESVTVTQSVKPPYLFHAGPDGKSSLPEFGIVPGDLAMNFIFRKMIRELPPERVRTVACRVFEMEGKDERETVRLYASAGQVFPLKAEWYARGETRPFRTLEVGSFTKKGELWMVTELSVSGPGWRSMVKFDSDTLKAGLIRNGIPRDLFGTPETEAK